MFKHLMTTTNQNSTESLPTMAHWYRRLGRAVRHLTLSMKKQWAIWQLDAPMAQGAQRN